MRNLKRALSLGLASVMLLGMMVVGAGAKGIDDYKDKDAIVNKDAVAVTSEIGIFAGYEDGTFGGDKVVTRAEMTVIICKMLYGADVKVDQFTESQVFTDVPAWAAGYVNLCASMNIVAGVGDNRFDPNSTVTTAQAALMLAKALGYFQNEADYGNSWMLAATATGTKIGLYTGLPNLSATAGLTRNDVAMMTFNALTNAVPVEYNEVFGVYYSAQGNLTAGVVFNYLDTLAFQNFDLVYKIKDNADDFGRPGKVWGVGSVKTNFGSGRSTDEKGNLITDEVQLLSKNEIVTVAETPDYVYTTNTKERVVRSNVGAELYKGSDTGDDAWTYFFNGESKSFELIGDLDKDHVLTKKGWVTELYIEDEDVTAIVYAYYLGQVSNVRTNSDGRYISVSTITPADSTTPSIDDKNFYTEAFEADDYVVFTVAYDGEDTYIASVSEPETAEGVLTAYNTKESESSLSIDGVKYNNGKEYVGPVDNDDLKINDEYTVYLDPNGFALGYEILDESTTKYAFVKAVDTSLGDYTARLVLADGSEVRVSVSDKSTAATGTELRDGGSIFSLEDRVVKYTVNSKDVYTLTNATAALADDFNFKNDERDLKQGTTPMTARFDDDTVFVDMDRDKVYVGYENVPTYQNATLAYAVKGKVIEAVFIKSGDAVGDRTFFYLLKTDSDFIDYDGVEYVAFSDAYVDGVKTTVYVDSAKVEAAVGKTGPGSPTLMNLALYEVDSSFEGNDGKLYVEKFSEVTSWNIETVGSVTSKYFEAGGNDYSYDSETVFVTITMDDGKVDSINDARGSALKAGNNASQVVIVAADQDDDYVEVVYIVLQK